MKITDKTKGTVTQFGYNIASGISSAALSASNKWLGDALGINNKVKGSKIDYFYDKDKAMNFRKTYVAPIAQYALQQAKTFAIQEGTKQLKKLVFGKGAKTKLNNTIDLVKANENKNTTKHYGQLRVNLDNKTGKDYITAVDMCGNYCPTAFIMGIKLEQPIPYKVNNAYNNGIISKNKKELQSTPDMTDTLVWFDCSALVSINSEKNLLLTPVQGRDYTRKELIANGDVAFTVSGRMCSNISGVYPADEVQKFNQIMHYKGVIRCNHIVLDQFGIDKFVIKSYSLPPKEGFENVQEYSFECVGIQPDKETAVEKDTIQILDYGIETSPKRAVGWSGLIKEKLEKLKQRTLTGAISSIEDNASKAADIYINKALD